MFQRTLQIFRQIKGTERSFRTCSVAFAKGRIPELTKDRYHLNRGSYATISDADVKFFTNLLGPTHILTDPDDTQMYNIDWMSSVRGGSQVVLKPTSTEEISEILRYCNEKNLAVCPQGGNTGLVGGSVPVFDEIVLSLRNLNKVDRIDEITGILVCQSGCILEKLEDLTKENGLCMPIDLGAKGTCHIGGNVSTNAGGLRLLRYGSLQGSVLGLEVVLADGKILDLMSNFKKDNTGYHLKHLFIGAEGTLGVITKLAIQCPTYSKSVHVAFLGLPTFDAVLKTFVEAKRNLGEILSSCEMIDERSLDASIKTFNLNCPIGEFPFYMLIETSGSNSEHDEEKFNKYLESVMEKEYVLDGTITNEPGKIKNIWQIRESVPSGIVNDGHCFKYDISLPLRNFYDIVPVTRDRLGDLAIRVCGYGHLGDSNLHLNVSCKEFTPEIYGKVEPFVYEYTSRLKGSVSAEHGIGFFKTKYLQYSKSDEAIDMMKSIKQLLDPKKILNPYKVLG